jgi:hypothetical protein
MADELTVAFTLPGRDADLYTAWRDQPPAFLTEGGYVRKDESYDTLVYEADVTGKGTRLLMFGMASTLYRLSVTFKPDATGATHVTMTGQAKDEVREAILRYADEHGSARAV